MNNQDPIKNVVTLIKQHFNHVQDASKKRRHAEMNSKHASIIANVCENAKAKRKANNGREEEKVRKNVWLWGAHFDIHRVPSLFTWEINGWKVKENKWEERWERGRAQTAVCHAERHIYQWCFSKKDISLWEQLFGSRQAVVTGKYIRPDLVCFGCFGDAAIMRDRGGRWLSRVRLIHFFFSASHPALVFSCSHALFLPVSLSSLLPYLLFSCLTLFFCKNTIDKLQYYQTLTHNMLNFH